MNIEVELRGRRTVPVAEAARFLGVSAPTLYRAIESGEVPNAGVSNSKRVPVWWLLKKLAPPNGDGSNAP